MAWDKDRPYAPFWNRKDIYSKDYGCMSNYGDGMDVTTEMIDTMYAEGVYVPPMVRYMSRITEQYEERPPSYVWRPFREVPLRLHLDHFEQRRAAGIFWWRDEDGKRYPMFATEFNRLVSEGHIAATIDGVWSAEKRGANYGISLVRGVA